MSKEQFTPQSNREDDLTALIDEIYSKKSTGITALMDAVFTKSDSYDSTSVTPETRTDEEISATPEKNNKNLPTKMAAGALAVAMAIGGIVGLGKLTEKNCFCKDNYLRPKKRTRADM